MKERIPETLIILTLILVIAYLQGKAMEKITLLSGLTQVQANMILGGGK